MMNDNSIPIVEPTIDYTKVPPIHPKRTVSFINHFIVTTVSFLNKFALNCEERLYEFENKLQKLEAAIIILESRLASVPGLDNKSPDTKDCNLEEQETVNTESNEKVDTMKTPEVINNVDEIDKNDEEKNPTQASNVEPISSHPLYRKYFKMVNVGVPKPAVKIKMAQEGLDPSLLDDPDQLVPKDESPTADG
ncbi:WASH complex subunit 3 [Chelonus insularis]|uniref:WASH complex subunit 3 n=1 Tax=Chelonus insularis TaxID=460826 RepID=UPI00158E48BC|nr:WASH complex subunit 3 [Chelonus insularis]XP_034950668.1 WASH complex subunit 3 [Chelonus insularis]XP_034950669.1 WASH complex subunit 3 [Chelonus insularis]